MPSRVVAAGIVAFWLATTGLVFHRDVWPRLFASGPPPVAIDLADEARQNVPADWSLYRNGVRSGKLTTRMKYLDAEDAFQFTYRYLDLRLEQSGVTVAMPEAVSEVRMTRAGRLKAETMTGTVKAGVGGLNVLEATIEVRGVVENGMLTGRAEVKSNWKNIAGDLEPVPVPPESQPMNPMQPVNRLKHVRGGQKWVVHESNPLQEALGKLLQKIGPLAGEAKQKQLLVAKVGDAPQTLRWQDQDVECWVIEYRREEVVARTWVRVSDGKVLRQEASEKGEALAFERED